MKMKNLIHLVGNQHVEINEIILLKAESNYSEIYLLNGKVIISSKTLKKFEKKLDYLPFFRTHKSFIVNIDHIAKYQPNNSSQIYLSNNFEVNVSRRRKQEFEDVLKILK